MAGPQDIQRYPKGLIDLLGMRATGDTPHQISNVVLGSIEMLDMYLADRVLTWRGTTGVPPAGTGFVASSITPNSPSPGEMWMLYGAGIIFAPIGAGTAIKAAFCIQRSAFTGSNIFQKVGEELNLAATIGGMAYEHFTRPIIVRPGDTFGVYTSYILGLPAISPMLMAQYAVLTT